MVLKSKKGEVEMTLDEHPKPKTTIEQLAKLPTVFKKGGVVTAGSGGNQAEEEELEYYFQTIHYRLFQRPESVTAPRR